MGRKSLEEKKIERKRNILSKYKRNSCYRLTLDLPKGTCEDIIAKLKSVDNKQKYLRDLIREDIKATQK